MKDVSEIKVRLVKKLIEKGYTISAMESCTGGLLASLITDVSGASDVIKGALVTYSNESKMKYGVPDEIIGNYGVYSGETAEAMAGACARAFGADIGVGITGSLGRKDPNNTDSIPGEVWYCILMDGEPYTYYFETDPDCVTREEMKLAVVYDIMEKTEQLLG